MKKYKISLCGNPNVGKSTIFNNLTGLKQHTGNWAGKTVENAKGKYTYQNTEYEIYDLPGTYSLITHSKEEEVAKEFLMTNQTDLTIIVCNAICLERSLNLALQILNLTKNALVVVNLMDEANKKQIKINLEKLASLLKVPVIGISAVDKKGITKLKQKIEAHISEQSPNAYYQKFTENNDDYANKIIKECQHLQQEVVTYHNKDYLKKERKIDKILTNKITGIPIMLFLLFVIFWLTIVGSNYPSVWLSEFFLSKEELLHDVFSFLPSFLNDALVYGLYKTTAWVVSVMLPPMLIFFPLFTILEDIGLLPRIAFNMDNSFSKCNSCGKQALTMCMGIGCNAVGVTGCRIIDSKRERLLAIITNSFMPCNGRYPTIIAIITMFLIGNSNENYSSVICALILVLVILLGIIMTFIINKILSTTILKGEKTSFILELSDYRHIKIGKLIIRSIIDRTIYVLGRALIVAAPAGIIIYLIANTEVNSISLLTSISNFLDPLAQLIGLDGIILLAFLLGFPANEIVLPILLMGYLGTGTLTDYENLNSLKTILIDNGWTLITAINFILFTVFHFPCSTTILTIKKETNSWFWTFISFITPLLIGISLCLITNTIFNLIC